MAMTKQEKLDAKAEKAYYKHHVSHIKKKPSDYVFNIINYAFFLNIYNLLSVPILLSVHQHDLR